MGGCPWGKYTELLYKTPDLDLKIYYGCRDFRNVVSRISSNVVIMSVILGCCVSKLQLNTSGE